MTWLARTAILAMLALGSADAQGRVVVTERGVGGSGRLLSDALARPHRLIEPDTSWFVQGRLERDSTSLIVLGRTAAIEGIVEGDVIVVGGDLHVRPGGRIAGRAIAIGGGVYVSARAMVAQGTESFRDNTFTIERTIEGYRLAYQEPYATDSATFSLPGFYGLRIPSYDRVNGASVGFGPAFSFAGGRGSILATATYRSDLGKIDPAVAALFNMTRRSYLELTAERGTFSNDTWIWRNTTNSVAALAVGVDTRNYFRADRAELKVSRGWLWTTSMLEPFVGARAERAWSVGPALNEAHGPWSAFGRTDIDGMWRPNPPILDGDIVSLLGGATAGWNADGIAARAHVAAEHSLTAPTPAAPGATEAEFTQVTLDFDIGFPTFGDHRYDFAAHWVTTPAGDPPPQRFAYLGGAGTLPLLDLLEQGGDELLLIDQRYTIPLARLRLRFVGVPTVQLRHRLGSAGLTELPSLEQLLAVGVHVAILRVEFQMDPASGKSRGTVGFSFAR